MEYYLINELAKKVGISKKAITYYQNEGIIKPTIIKENGYRYYNENDIITLQKVVALKYFGFSIKDIRNIIYDNNKQSFLEFLEIQINIIDDKISSLLNIKKTIETISENIDTKNNFEWNEIIRSVKILSMNDDIAKQYKDSNNLNARIKLHKLFSINKNNWYKWLYDNYNFSKKQNVLEIGCGNGELWYQNRDRVMKEINLFITDLSAGMIKSTKRKLNGIIKAEFNIVDCCNIPYSDHSMDVIIANHVIFYASKIEDALKEIKRVLKNDGILYCSTYGSFHMKEIEEIVKKFDTRIHLSNINLYEIFGLENGQKILSRYFNSIIKYNYYDELNITEITPLYNYIISCHGNQNDIILKKNDKFIQYLKTILQHKDGIINVKKQAGLFICK